MTVIKNLIEKIEHLSIEKGLEILKYFTYVAICWLRCKLLGIFGDCETKFVTWYLSVGRSL